MRSRIYIEITNRCNLSCDFCPGTRRPPRTMTPAEFRALAQKLRGETGYLYLHVLGEPLLHPQLPELLAIAGELGFRVCLVTNGTLLSRQRDALLGADALWLAMPITELLVAVYTVAAMRKYTKTLPAGGDTV